VVCICSPTHLERCLDALATQQDAPEFEVVVCHDPNIQGLQEVAQRHPQVRLFANAGQRTPLELASAALAAARGDVILLTEDHCVPRADWVRQMLEARADGRAAVGGRVEIRDGASAVDWAFYFVDFFRYAAPVPEGGSPSLTVCNVAYERDKLEAVRELWEGSFHETAINGALAERFGSLWLAPESAVTMRREVTLGDALYERYAFGRLFGCTRIAYVSGPKRLFYALTAPALPLLLFGRMLRKALRSRTLLRAFTRSAVPLAGMVLWWSWGEWLGYLSGRQPGSLVVAPEIRAAQREIGSASGGGLTGGG